MYETKLTELNIYLEYVNTKTPVKIICENHGMFLQTPYSHLSGKGCPKCFGTPKSNSKEFIEKSIKIHGITNEIAQEKGEDIEQTLNNFLKDLSDVNIIVSHNAVFHLRTIQGELIRYNIQFNFKKYIIIDTISFQHNLSFPKLKQSNINFSEFEYKIIIKV